MTSVSPQEEEYESRRMRASDAIIGLSREWAKLNGKKPLTKAELAERFGISVKTLDRWLRPWLVSDGNKDRAALRLGTQPSPKECEKLLELATKLFCGIERAVTLRLSDGFNANRRKVERGEISIEAAAFEDASSTINAADILSKCKRLHFTVLQQVRFFAVVKAYEQDNGTGV